LVPRHTFPFYRYSLTYADLYVSETFLTHITTKV
jgi:hypothetical protein